MNATNKKWGYLILLALIWGSSFILIKKGLIGLKPLQLGAIRIIITSLVLFLFGFKRMKLITKTEWKWIAISGLLGSFFPVFLFAIAQTEIDSAIASILNSLVPLNTVLLGAAVFKIASTRRQVLGVIIGFIGTALLILKGADLNPEQNYFYAGFVLLSGIMYASNVNIIKRYLQNVDAISLTMGNYVIIFIPAVIMLFVSGFFSLVTFEHPEFMTSIGYVIILSIFGTALAKVLFAKLVQLETPVFASSVTYLMPIIALMWGVIDGEAFSVLQGLATIVILIGIYLANKRKNFKA
ncbi:permease [Flavobacteriaceae bacterium AU392]|nr:permease [Flavobacteriaceae bacterium]RKM85045.1 permease [Flavobacteriaceae bacterium AU392]